MSKGFGPLQIKIIEYLENVPGNGDDSPNIIKKIAQKNPPTPSEKSKIYKSIQRLKERNVLLISKTKNINYLGTNLMPHQRAKTLILDKENKDYKKFR